MSECAFGCCMSVRGACFFGKTEGGGGELAMNGCDLTEWVCNASDGHKTWLGMG